MGRSGNLGMEEILEQVKEGRNLEEIVSDHLLLLYLIKKHEEASDRYLGITKLQKYVFLSENLMNKNCLKGLNYNFFRYNYGPMSKQLYTDINLFKKLGLIYKERIKLTEKGNEIIKKFQELFLRNKKIIEKIDNQIETLGQMDTEEIKEFVYNIKKYIGCHEMKIKDIPMFLGILSKLKEENAKAKFDLSEEDIETLNLLLDDDTRKTISQITFPKEKSVPFQALV